MSTKDVFLQGLSWEEKNLPYMKLFYDFYRQVTCSKFRTLIYFVVLNLPLWVMTFDTASWSDDSYLTNFIAVRGYFTPLTTLLFEFSGSRHFSPVYNLFNLLVASISVNPVFFHSIIMLCYVLTAFFVYLLVERIDGNKKVALLAGSLFALNYYASFKALLWNAFHSHATNTLTGVISVYFLVVFVRKHRWRSLIYSSMFFFLTIFNYESGFVFLPILIIMVVYFWLKHLISLKQGVVAIVLISMVMALFPLGCYLVTGDINPQRYRFSIVRNAQNYAFHGTELFWKATGLSFLYNKFVINSLKENVPLKEVMIRVLRKNDASAIKDISVPDLVVLVTVCILMALLAIFMLVLIWTRLRREYMIFAGLVVFLFCVYVFAFYRVDVANTIAVFSSIVLASVIVSLLSDPGKFQRSIGLGFLSLYAMVTIGTVFDQFDDCYQKSFFGISRVAFEGPERLYRRINAKVGHFMKDGFILFTYDYSPYHRTSGFERIGDMLSLADLYLYNATAFRDDFLESGLVEQYKDRSGNDLFLWFHNHPAVKRVIVSSKSDALDYLRKNNVDVRKVEPIFITRDYQVELIGYQG